MSGLITVGLILTGGLLRLKCFLEDQSLWLDEAYVALEITVKSYWHILTSFAILQDQPRTPPLFQLIEKINADLCGPSEMSLRLWPLVAGVLALGLFYLLLKKLSDPLARPIAMGLFALNEHLIYYAAEVKPYSSDALVSLALLLVYMAAYERKFSLRSVWIFSVSAAILLWMSFGAMFISLGIFGTMLTITLLKRNWEDFKNWSKGSLLFLLSFIIVYATNFRLMVQSGYVLGTWKESFMPLQEGFGASCWWLWTALVGMAKNPLAISVPVLGLGLIIIGFESTRRKNNLTGWILIAPLLLCLFAACLMKYPFSQRMLLFLLPALCLFTAHGIVAIVHRIPRWRPVIMFLLLGLVFFDSVASAGFYMMHPHQKTDNRAIFKFLDQYLEPGDHILFNDAAQYAFSFYVPRFGMQAKFQPATFEKVYPISVIKVRDDSLPGDLSFQVEDDYYSPRGFTGMISVKQNPTQEEARSLLHGRYWIILSEKRDQIKGKLLAPFDQWGKRTTSFEPYDTGIYLYVFGQN